MNSADEQLYRGDKVMKRGVTGRDQFPFQENTIKERGSPTFLSLPPSEPSAKLGRSWRGLPRRYTLVIFSFLSIFALAASFLFACSMSSKPLLDTDAFYYNPKLQRLPLQETITEPQFRSSFSALGCDANEALLRVFMYDLQPEFHYGMLSMKPSSQIWPRELPPYPGGLYQQHSPEYWLTSDLLTSNMPNRKSLCTAYRVEDWRLADVIFVPFFASLSYNKFTTRSERKVRVDKNRELQEKLMKFLRRHPAWVAAGGADHVIVIHHPNSMHRIRDHLRNAIFVVADFGRYDPNVANIGKDVVAPYQHVVQGFLHDTTDFESRKTLLFFQGAIIRKEGGIIRQLLYDLIKDEPGVHFEAGNTTTADIYSATVGMRASKFCLNLAGDTPSSNRLFDSIASHCVPVIVSDDIELPFEDELDYTSFCLFVKSSDALKRKFLINLLRSVSKEEWTRMWRRLKEVDQHFKYQYPSKPDDAVHMTWKAIARKVSKVRLHLNRQRRYKISSLKLENS